MKERIGLPALVELIDIDLSPGRKARMKIRRCPAHGTNQYRPRKSALQRRKKLRRTVPPLSIEMKHLPERVHTGVGATASVDPHIPVEQRPQMLFNHILHRATARLALPAAEVAAVVGAKASPSLKRSPGFGGRGHTGTEFEPRRAPCKPRPSS